MEVPILGSWWPIVTLFLGGLLYLYATWNHDYWRKRGVAHVKPRLLLGNLAESMWGKKTLGEIYRDIYWKLDGHKFGGAFRFSQPVLLVRDPELIKTILVKEFTSFHDNNMQVDIDVDPMFGRNPFVLRGDRWKITRSQLISAFTVAKMKPLFPLIEEVCEELKQYIEKNRHSGEFEAKELSACYTTDVVASCAFGIHGNCIQDPQCEFRSMGRKVLEPTFINNVKIMSIFLLPKLADILRVRFVPKVVEDFFMRIVKEVMTHREQSKISRPDFLQHLIGLKTKSVDSDTVNGHEFAPEKNIFLDEDIAAQAVTFFLDGFETSSAALSFSLYSLATNPDIQAKVREEVDSVMKKHGGHLTFEGISEMTYLDMVFSEALRLYPPVLFIVRDCTKPFKLETQSGGTFEVEAGTPVVIPVYALHQDPRYYPDPKTYDPQRFTEENKKTRNKYIYLPFGEGPRICLGVRFAHMQVKAGIASIVSNFELRPTKRTPLSISPDPKYFMYAAKGGLWIQFVKLKK